MVVDTFPASTPHASYIVHHNGPQYFGYLGDNPAEISNMHGLQQFYTDVANRALPANGGVFYVRGGYYNNDGLITADPSPAVRTTFSGNDDHGTYSDSQISEAMVADSVNAIVNSPYWPQSAIIISYDESDGFYDHAPEAIRNWGPDGLPMSGGPRIPTIVLSPYVAAHTVSHVYSEHGSIVRFIDQVFGLTPLTNLPDEKRARALGARTRRSTAPAGRRRPNSGRTTATKSAIWPKRSTTIACSARSHRCRPARSRSRPAPSRPCRTTPARAARRWALRRPTIRTATARARKAIPRRRTSTRARPFRRACLTWSRLSWRECYFALDAVS
ncbi:MAG: alkaline phosphatase family protein [Rhodospirillales bacterium]